MNTPRAGSSPIRHWSRAIVALLVLIAISSTSALAVNTQCQSNDGDAECAGPIVGPKYCHAGALIFTSEPPCTIDPIAKTGSCTSEGVAMTAMFNNWKSTFPHICSGPRNEPCTPFETVTRYLGVNAYVGHAYESWASYRQTDGSCPAENTQNSCARGDGTNGWCANSVACPPGYKPDFTPNQAEGYCKRIKPRFCPGCSGTGGGLGGGSGGGGSGDFGGSTKEGNPIDLAVGEKTNEETDIPRLNGSLLEFRRFYSNAGFYTPVAQERPRNGIGVFWQHSFQQRILVDKGQFSAAAPMAVARRANGQYRRFKIVAGAWTAEAGAAEKLIELTDTGGNRLGWTYTTTADEVETYDSQGRLLSIETRDGLRADIDYSDATTPTSIAPYSGLPIAVIDNLSRTLELRYNDQGLLASVTGPDGQIYQYRYDNTGTLAYVDFPGGSSRGFLYNETAHAGSLQLGWKQLTGIIDENGQRFATYKYDDQGRGIEEWHGSGAANMKVEYGGSWLGDQVVGRYTNALGLKRVKRFTAINGAYHETQLEEPSCAGSGCTPVTRTRKTTFDSAGLRDRVTDFRDIVTDYDYNARALEILRRENVTAGVCPTGTTTNASNYTSSCTVGTCWKTTAFPGSTSATPLGFNGWQYSCRPDTGPGTQTRSTETDWHTNFRVPTERRLRNAANTLEAKSQWAYNSRGQVVARCEIDIADAAAMAYTCSDSVAPSASAKVRRWTYTYCEAADVAAPNSTCPILGFAKTVNGPRAVTDPGMNGLDDITTYAYYPSTDETGCGTVGGICHRKGDLHTVTNALGHVSENVAYDKNGRVVRSRDPNNTITDIAYNSRGWLLSRTVRALASGANNADDATTTFAYDNVGQVTRVTQPDGAYLNYSYDDAHRLTDIVDNLSNRIHYTLDAAGNRIKEETFDANYNPATPGVGLKRVLSREYNALSRLVRTLNASNAATRDSTPYDTSPLADGYDANGNSVQFKDGLNVQTQQSYDALNRLVKTIQDYTGTDPETANAAIEYGYDTRDNLRIVKDPSNLTTTYTYDGIGNQVALDSPDTGHTGYTYDLNGNVVTQTDNRGIASALSYDATNRLIGIEYPTTTLNISYKYDQEDAATGCVGSHPKGRLTNMVDSSGATTYCYDRRGNVVRKIQTTTGTSLAIAYTYDKADRIKALTYPSGGIATYLRDISGRIINLTWQYDASATPVDVVSNITYNPFGPLNVLTFGNGRTLTKLYDKDYAIDIVASSANNGLALDFSTDRMGNVVGVRDAVGTNPNDRQYIYDKLYRLTQVNDAIGTMLEDYNYNKAGDRTLKKVSGELAQVYSYLSGTHRLNTVSGSVRNYDLNGNTTDRGDAIALEYNAQNRLASVTKPGHLTYYSYSGRGERVQKRKVTPTSETSYRYLYNQTGQLIAEIRSGEGGVQLWSEYLFIETLPVSEISASSKIYFETDHLGVARVAANASDNSIKWSWSLLHTAFGEHDAEATETGSSFSMRYPGQALDDETGLFFNYFRNYESATGRYLESDPIGLSGGVSTFGYAMQNPMSMIDRFGLAFGLIDCGKDQRYHYVPIGSRSQPDWMKTCSPRPPEPQPCSPSNRDDCELRCDEVANRCSRRTTGVGIAAGVASVGLAFFPEPTTLTKWCAVAAGSASIAAAAGAQICDDDGMACKRQCKENNYCEK